MADKKALMMSLGLSVIARSRVLWHGLALALLLSVSTHSFAAAQQSFASPEAAVAALRAAFKADDDVALIAIFGEKHKRLVVSSDRQADALLRQGRLRSMEEFTVITKDGNDRRTVVMGYEAWPMPIPLVRENGQWRFASEVGEDEIMNRRIGANELNAIAVMRAYVDAQKQYATRDRNGDGVIEFAQKLGSSPGKRDGLYWAADAAKGEEQSPFGPLVADSDGELENRQSGEPYRGYRFRILKRQGKNAAGGAFNYVINGRMLAGFALIAYPSDFGDSGVMTFVVNANGKIYQKNIGADGAKLREFNPDASWTVLDSPY